MPTHSKPRDDRSPLAILTLAAVIRLTALEADPPPTLSSDFLSDESWWAHNARNHALFGSWRLDDFNQGLFAAPLHTLFERVSFAVGGVGRGGAFRWAAASDRNRAGADQVGEPLALLGREQGVDLLQGRLHGLADALGAL